MPKKNKMRALFIGVRLEACRTFCAMMSNFGYKTTIVTFRKSFIAKNRGLFQGAKMTAPLAYDKNKALDYVGRLLKNSSYKILLSSGFPYILPDSSFKLKTVFVNSHPHLLPKYRGLKVIRESYKKGERTYGVTTHLMNKRVDSGKILVARRLTFIPNGNRELEILYQLLFSFLEPAVIIETLALLRQKKLI